MLGSTESVNASEEISVVQVSLNDYNRVKVKLPIIINDGKASIEFTVNALNNDVRDEGVLLSFSSYHYKDIFDGYVENNHNGRPHNGQVAYDHNSDIYKAGTYTIEVDLPTCGSIQVDFYRGDPIDDLTGKGHGGLLFGSSWLVIGPNSNQELYTPCSFEINIEKVVDKSLACVGEEVVYTFTVTNPNDITLSEVIVTDLLFGETWSHTVHTGEENEGQLAPGESYTFSQAYTLTEANIGTLSNTAIANGEYFVRTYNGNNDNQYEERTESVEDTSTVEITVSECNQVDDGETEDEEPPTPRRRSRVILEELELEETVELLEEEVPEALPEPVIEEVVEVEPIEELILDETVAEALPVSILEDEVLPQTGGIPLEVLSLMGVAITSIGVVLRKRKS